jgi:hypothetical protein
VVGLAHQLGEAGAQRMAGVAFRIEPGVQRGLLDQAGDRLVGELCAGAPAGLGDGAEQQSFGARPCAGGSVEIGCGAAVHAPSVERGEGAEPRLRRIGPDRDRLALAVLVGLRAPGKHLQVAAGDGGDVTEGQGDQLGAA